METFLTLKGILNFNNQLLIEAVSQGVRSFLEWGILNSGGFATVAVATPGTPDPYSDDLLHPVQQEGTPDNVIWESKHSQWVYETGLDLSPLPVINSGVYVNGTFCPTASTTGPLAHRVDFPEGRVIFNSAVPATSVVQAAYSYRRVHFYGHEVPWFRDVVLDAFLVDQPRGAGFVNLLAQNRVQMPAIVVEPVMGRRLRGLQLGSGAQWVEQDVLFHVMAQRADERNNLVDILTLQKDKTFYLYDINARREADDYPLDWRGSPVPGASTYPQLLDLPPAGYRWKSCYFSRVSSQDVTLRLPLYRAAVRATLEVDFNSM